MVAVFPTRGNVTEKTIAATVLTKGTIVPKKLAPTFSSLAIILDTVFRKVGSATETTIVLIIAMKKIVRQSPVPAHNLNVRIWNSVFTNRTSATESTIAMTVQMNWDVQASRQISVRTNISNVNRRKFVSLKVGTAMVPKIAMTNQTNLVLVVPLIVLIISSNVKTKSVFTKVLFVMVRMTVEMDQTNQPMMLVVNQWLLVHPVNGNVQVCLVFVST
jgi:hypothetical protein